MKKFTLNFKFGLLFFSLSLLFLVACGGGNKGSENAVDSTATAIPENGGGIGIPELFGPFYQKFCSDKAFQKERTMFPMPMKSYKLNDVRQPIDSTYWDESNWKGYLAFNEFQQAKKAQNDPGPWQEKIDSSKSGICEVMRFIPNSDAGETAVFQTDLKSGNYMLVKFTNAATFFGE